MTILVKLYDNFYYTNSRIKMNEFREKIFAGFYFREKKKLEQSSSEENRLNNLHHQFVYLVQNFDFCENTNLEYFSRELSLLVATDLLDPKDCASEFKQNDIISLDSKVISQNTLEKF